MKVYLIGLGEKVAMTALQMFVATLLLAGSLGLDVAAAAALAGIAAGITVIVAAIHTWLTSGKRLPNVWLDIVVRVAATFIEAFLTGITAGGVLNISVAHTAFLAGLTAALAALKTLLASRIGNTGTAAALPLRLDPPPALAAAA